MISHHEYLRFINIFIKSASESEIKEMNDLIMKDGGIGVILVGTHGLIPEFKTHAQLRFIDCKETDETSLSSLIPSNTKFIIIADGVPHKHYLYATSVCNRAKIPFLVRKTNQAIYDQLKQFFPNNGSIKPTIEEVKDTQIKGKLNILIEHIDFSKSNAENATALLKLATEKNIKTTHASLAQFVANHRKAKSGGTVPRSARSKLDVSVELLDDMIKELTDMREFLIATTEENRLLKDKVEKFRKALE